MSYGAWSPEDDHGTLSFVDVRDNQAVFDFYEDRLTVACGIVVEAVDGMQADYVHLRLDQARLLAQTIVRHYGVAPVADAEQAFRDLDEADDDE
jgi:hypothetical protein